MQKWRTQPQQFCKIDFTVFSIALVIIAAISTVGIVAQPYPFHFGGAVSLPHTRSYQLLLYPIAANVTTISISSRGRIYIGNDPISASALTTKIQTNLSQGAIQRIYIFSDAHVKYSYVKTVIDAIHDARVEHITFLVSRTNSSSLDVLTPSNN